MLATFVGALAFTTPTIKSRSSPIVCSEGFCRAPDFLSSGEQASERAVVNVLGRWAKSSDWDTIGIAKVLDDCLDGKVENYPEGLPVEATPRRRDFCKRQGQVQRYIFNKTVVLLPFENEALAASVGATAAELNAEPLEPFAVDVVFDALAASQSGIVGIADCDERRASYETAEGAFDKEAFAEGLSTARRNIIASYAVYPGIPNAIFLFLGWRLDAFSAAQDNVADVLSVVQTNFAESPGAVLLPLLPLALVGYGAANPPRSSKAASEAAYADKLFLKERVSTRLATEAKAATKTEVATEAEVTIETATEDEVSTPTLS